MTEIQIINNMLETGALVRNESNGDIYLVLSDGALAVNPAKQACFDFLRQFNGSTYGGLDVREFQHKLNKTGIVVPAIKLTDPLRKPDWMKVLGL